LFIFALTAASVAVCLVYIHPSTTLNALSDLLLHECINYRPFACVSIHLRLTGFSLVLIIVVVHLGLAMGGDLLQTGSIVFYLLVRVQSL
jgi:hypothetical protein